MQFESFEINIDRFDAKHDLSGEDWKEILDEVKDNLEQNHLDSDYTLAPRELRDIKKLSPDKFEEFNLDETNFKLMSLAPTMGSVAGKETDYRKLAEVNASLTEIAPQYYAKDPGFKEDDWKKLSGLFHADKDVGDWARVASLAADIKKADLERFNELPLDEIWNDLKTTLSDFRSDEKWQAFAELAADMAICAPEKAGELALDAEAWIGMKTVFQEARTLQHANRAEEKKGIPNRANFDEVLKFSADMQVLAAVVI